MPVRNFPQSDVALQKKPGQNNERINSLASNIKVEQSWCGKVSRTSLIIAPFVSLELQIARYPYTAVCKVISAVARL